MTLLVASYAKIWQVMKLFIKLFGWFLTFGFQGTGKTCLCLAVIMATKGLHASVGNGNILRTDLLKAQETNGPHSLRDIAAAGVLEAGIDWKQWEHDLPKDIVEKMLKHPACYEWCDISPLMLERERRKDVVFPTFDIYTSCATLVIGKSLLPQKSITKECLNWFLLQFQTTLLRSGREKYTRYILLQLRDCKQNINLALISSTSLMDNYGFCFWTV